MLTLTQSAGVKGSAGEPLPTVWEGLKDAGAIFRRGQLALIAAGPGVGKSALVLSYALRAKVPCMYFSADSDAYVQLSRSLAILGGMNMQEANSMALNPDHDTIAGIVGQVPVRFSYNPSPTLNAISTQVLAYEELYGDYPELIVVDNALDVVMEGGDIDQSQSLDALMAWLHDLARETQACVIVLHHVTGPYNDANQPIPLSGVKGQIGRVPEMILTLHKQIGGYGEIDELRVSVVKNRGFKADPTGSSFATLDFDGFSMKIEDALSLADGFDDPFEDTYRRDEELWTMQ